MIIQRYLAVLMTAVLFLGCSSARAVDDGVISLKREAITAVHTAAVGLCAVLKDVPEKEAQLKIIRQFVDPSGSLRICRGTSSFMTSIA